MIDAVGSRVPVFLTEMLGGVFGVSGWPAATCRRFAAQPLWLMVFVVPLRLCRTVTAVVYVLCWREELSGYAYEPVKGDLTSVRASASAFGHTRPRGRQETQDVFGRSQGTQ